MHEEPTQHPAHAAATQAPNVGTVGRALLRHVVLPGLIAAALLWIVGWIIAGPLDKLPAEEAFNKDLEAGRTPQWNTITHYWSTIADTWWTIGLAILYSLIVWAITRKWWLGLIPVLAITLEASIFVPVTNAIGRPRPLVEMLDPAPPTSSFPSGHTAAAFALYLALLLLAFHIPHKGLRLTIQIVCAIIPFLVMYARLYRGMHHLSDVFVGLILGIWCAITVVRAIPGAWPFAARPAGGAEASSAQPAPPRS